MSLRSLPAGSATATGRIDNFHVERAAACLPDAHRANASFWISHCLERHIEAVDNREGHNPAIKKQAAVVAKAVAALRGAMGKAGPETVTMLGIAHGKNVSPDLGGGAVEAAEKFEVDIQDCRDFLEAVARAADRVAKELPSQNRSDSMHELVGRLAEIWQSATGQRPTTNRNRQSLPRSHGFDAFIECTFNALPVGCNYLYGQEAAVQSVVDNWKRYNK